MNGADRGLLLKVQEGGRITIPQIYRKANGIEDGALVIVKIEKAVIRGEKEIEEE